LYKGHQCFNLRHPTDGMIVELLSEGRQIVLPPSIHPDTSEPYTANCELLEVLDQILELPLDIEAVLRDALRAMGINVQATGTFRAGEFIAAGARDSKMVSHAGIIARDVIRGARTLVEGLSEIRCWVEDFTEKVEGDELDPEKAVKKVIEFLVRDVTGKNRSLPSGWDEGLSESRQGRNGSGSWS
jgi:putative DNA primase/helicase